MLQLQQPDRIAVALPRFVYTVITSAAQARIFAMSGAASGMKADANCRGRVATQPSLTDPLWNALVLFRLALVKPR